jgi:hypothetical protein
VGGATGAGGDQGRAVAGEATLCMCVVSMASTSVVVGRTMVKQRNNIGRPVMQGTVAKRW